MQLFLIGGGVCHESLKKEALELGIQDMVEFTGYIPSPREYLAVSDVYVSSARREGLSLSVLEAMAAGLPVIATDAGGVRDLARENGILIDNDDEEALYAAMKKLRDDPPLRAAMGGRSLEMVRAFSAKSMAEQYGALYEKLCNVLHYNH
jgi:glycosyltransferase EpsD